MLEVERYDFENRPAYLFMPDRRDFFKLRGGGIAVLLLLGDEAEAQESSARGRRGGGAGNQPRDIGAGLHIGEVNKVTVLTGKVEVGQKALTALTQAVSEELHIGHANRTWTRSPAKQAPIR